MILPGSTIGILGGGQLGRLFIVAARTMGYRTVVLDPDPLSPAGLIADQHIRARYEDEEALESMGRSCSAITTEFENVPAGSLKYLSRFCLVMPSETAVSVTQDRIHEKTFLQSSGFDTAPFAAIESQSELAPALEKIGLPALLKTSRFGYDGKGQYLIRQTEDLNSAFTAMDSQPCVLEQLLDLEMEVSVVVARGMDGNMATYPVVENQHRHGILDITIAPGRTSQAIAEAAVAAAKGIAEKLNYNGVLAVEIFVLKDGRLLVNELAPRPHNSGHYTLDACVCSQFDQQVRTLCGLPLADTRVVRPAVMVNLLGDLWHGQAPPDWSRVLKHPEARLHIYGKQEARPGRKMGHFTVLGENLEAALATALEIKKKLEGS